ncbi:acyltransferase [Aliarcobacter cryaerophilus]|uniref:acyltransferase n=1 Tax=Aliarcobacter cryaerophilus TaxID=28198 RepID=UPI0028CB4968|nr:acyltransferase [Aliarcobacter cryaerophilus]
MQKIFFFNKKVYWPVDWKSKIIGSEYIYIGVGSAPGYSFGCYITASEKSPIFIGDYVIIAPNVIMPGRNHNLYNYKVHDDGGITIGNYCWIGANSVILPNVELGNHVIVGAGSVVTKSFKDGYVVIAGNPAKIVRHLDKDKCIEYKDKNEYHGYIKKSQFDSFRKNRLHI